MIKCEDVHEGMVLIADDGFRCLHNGQHCEVKRSGGGLYVECTHGHHYLDGQIEDGGYIGFTALAQSDL